MRPTCRWRRRLDRPPATTVSAVSRAPAWRDADPMRLSRPRVLLSIRIQKCLPAERRALAPIDGRLVGPLARGIAQPFRVSQGRRDPPRITQRRKTGFAHGAAGSAGSGRDGARGRGGRYDPGLGRDQALVYDAFCLTILPTETFPCSSRKPADANAAPFAMRSRRRRPSSTSVIAGSANASPARPLPWRRSCRGSISVSAAGSPETSRAPAIVGARCCVGSAARAAPGCIIRRSGAELQPQARDLGRHQLAAAERACLDQQPPTLGPDPAGCNQLRDPAAGSKLADAAIRRAIGMMGRARPLRRSAAIRHIGHRTLRQATRVRRRRG